MDAIRYTPKRVAQILGVDLSLLADAAGPLAARTFKPAELAMLRDKLGKRPPQRPVRRQLFLNFKGGTGKTSVSVSYAYRLAELGYRVLLVDLDSQGHAAKCLGIEASVVERTLADVLVRKLPVREAILQTGLPGLDLVPANLSMATVDISLMPLPARETRLKKALEEVETGYSFVVMDAPPSFGLVNLNAVVAADDLIVPVLSDFLSYHGLKLLFETVESLEEDLPLRLEQVFVVVNAFNQTFKIAREAREALEQHYGEHLCKTVIRQCTRFAQASSEGVPVVGLDPESKGAQDVMALVDEVLARIDSATSGQAMGASAGA